MMSRIVRCCSSLIQSQPNAAIYKHILPSFPKGIEMAFSYGSAVFQQEGHPSKDKNMLDFIFVVDDPLVWHKENLEMNLSHYSFLKIFGAKRIASIQEKFGAGVYFNTLIPFENRLIKYGIISTDKVITDLLDWETLYVSGRLHKPVKFIRHPSNSDLLNAIDTNLNSAIHSALLLLPETFTEVELYETITGLSYSGDIRMSIGEDQQKIRKIVAPNLEHFRALYEPILDKEEHIHWFKSAGKFEQYPNIQSQWHHLNLLPSGVHQTLIEFKYSLGRYEDHEEILRAYAHDSYCCDHVKKAIATIVKSSSFKQSAKGILTAGIIKSFKYSLAKVKKMIKSRQK